MSARDRTTSVKLDAETRRRLGRIAALRGRSAHTLMKEAIARLIEREEMVEWMIHIDRHHVIDPKLRPSATRTRIGASAGLPDHVVKQIAAGNNRLRVLRGWRGMSLTTLAKAVAAVGANVGETVLREIEEDIKYPEPGLWAALAKALNVKAEDLLG